MVIPREWVDAFALGADLVAILGVPAALYVFLLEKRRERRDREYGTYHALDEKYLEFLKLAVQHPELDLYPSPKLPLEDTPQNLRAQRLAMFEFLVSIFERAHIMYVQQGGPGRDAQWLGWRAYIRQLKAAPGFPSLWHAVGSNQFDSTFVRFMDGHES